MSELKTYFLGKNNGREFPVYLKSEADKVIAELEEKLDIYKRGWMENDKVNANQYAEIRHHKYKRCLAMAHICYKNSIACANYTMPHEKYKHWRRWGGSFASMLFA